MINIAYAFGMSHLTVFQNFFGVSKSKFLRMKELTYEHASGT
jgi:hypothetical protein